MKKRIQKVHCTRCGAATNQKILATEKIFGEYRYDDDDIEWSNVYQIIQCQGCDEISFRRVYMSSEYIDPYTGQLEETEYLYPNPAETRISMEGLLKLPRKTRKVYREVLIALSHGAPILAAIGLRAVIESVCLDQKTKSKDLAKGIDELADMGHLSKTQAKFLHQHRFMGNVAAHELVAPEAENLIAALDIAETLLKTIYVLPTLADTLNKK